MIPKINAGFAVFIASVALLVSCSPGRFIAKQARLNLLSDTALAGAHIGISVFDPQSGKQLYDHHGDKYFVPASNTKLFTCYAAMKFLGDSLVAAKYLVEDDKVIIEATGDPTFLHPDFKRQPLFTFLQQPSVQEVEIVTPFASQPLGRGWAWDDYTSTYMAERDPFPIYGNIATITFTGDTLQTIPPAIKQQIAGLPAANERWDINRNYGRQFFTITNGRGNTDTTRYITLSMERGSFAARYLSDTLHKPVIAGTTRLPVEDAQLIFSQPVDTVLRIMMHRSDNFIAEQLLLMVSERLLNDMSDRRVVDTLLKSVYHALPQQPKWVDGSGLSRYNLFTPHNFTWLINRMEQDFGEQRLQDILPTGGEGTLSGLYKNYSGRIYAKTGTLSNHVALSGIIYTQKNKKLLFSVLVNNHQTSSSTVRKGIEKMLSRIMERY